ncbi:unnamed protein product (macronuclear) [Paramecium tetraurelia]|uniref:Uncharacterized protein n=1 Tax=Paramecium tetraurelia TaxID=5888 RepID=A0CHV7_PARTE|nr:uncharacterized protein GSPATT00038476001 [Paramecium tetraurelia]CAK70374.1 unnamed protein product [Paramecium tetraurelia]|eukprot:XP_001437771.1 hypothetical protein (macronuclear) [Paramecium tetraurelia strain d4-2]
MSQSNITQRIPTEKKQETKEIKENIIHDRIIGRIFKAPGYLQDQSIKHGYRINFKNKKDVIKSKFMWHNELVNIWTYLIGAIIEIVYFFFVSSLSRQYSIYGQIMRNSFVIEPIRLSMVHETTIYVELLHNIYEHAFTLEQKIQQQLGRCLIDVATTA